jgi:hypothetical protein
MSVVSVYVYVVLSCNDQSQNQAPGMIPQLHDKLQLHDYIAFILTYPYVHIRPGDALELQLLHAFQLPTPCLKTAQQ